MTPNQLLAACNAGDGGSSEWDIPYSLRFRKSNLAYLSRTPAAAGNRKTWTWSGWVKLGEIATAYTTLFSSGPAANQTFASIVLTATGQIALYANSSGTSPSLISNQLLRDPSAHYNVLVVFDSTNATADDRMRIYINSVRITSFSTNLPPSLNLDWGINAAQEHRIGNGVAYPNSHFHGYLSEVHFIDGQALDPSYFGKISQQTGQWVPIRYTGTYGNNGFYLDFKDNSALTNLGYDKSGNSNHWTPNNFSLTAGATYDSMIDTPTNNFPVLNAIDKNANGTIGDAGMAIASSSQWIRCKASIGIRSGKWYWETQHLTYNQTYQGICDDSFLVATNYFLGGTSGWSASYNETGSAWVNNVNTGVVGATLAIGDILAFALDMDNGILQAYKNGVLQGTVVSGFLSRGVIYPAFSLANGATGKFNFGQRPFAYTPPDGFKALCSKNLPTPSIKRGDTGFDVVTYTGNGIDLQVGESAVPKYNYLIDKALRFRGVNSSLSRTPAATGNRRKWTFSAFVKRATGNFAVLEGILGAGITTTTTEYIAFNASGNLVVAANDGSNSLNLVTNRTFSNHNWIHLVVSYDSDQELLDNRGKIFVDNVLQILNTQVLTLSRNSFLTHTVRNAIGSTSTTTASGNYLEGYMAEVYFIDGQALDPTAFGEYDAGGYWIPKAYAGTYGQNGYYLDFEDTSAVANLGYDKSGLGNNWTPNNFSLTAGYTYDSMVDRVMDDFLMMSVLRRYNDFTQLGTNVASLIDAGLTISHTSNQLNNSSITYHLSSFSVPAKGQWYFEYERITGYALQPSIQIVNEANSIAHLSEDTTCDIAVDFDVKKYWVRRSGVWSGDPVAKTGGIALSNSNNLTNFRIRVCTMVSLTYGYPNNLVRLNFGQRPFNRPIPEGFKTISKANIDIVNETTLELEYPDLVWIKCLNSARNHMLFDSIRGPSKSISSNLTAAEVTDANSLISFNKNGFYIGNAAAVNTLNNTYAAWMWKANQQQVTNNDGTITSQVRSNPAIGFSVVSLPTVNASGGTFGHGLGIEPSFIISKVINNASAVWWVYHKDYPTGYGYLNSTNAFTTTNAINAWGNNTAVVAPSSQVVTVGSSYTYSSGGSNIINYCFAEVDGFSKFGKYIGNGNADGPFVFCNGKPRFIMVKRIDAASSWFMWDTERDSDNVTQGYVLADTTGVETGTIHVDILSNGFKLRSAIIANVANGQYIFAAFMENPFKYSPAK